MKMETGEMFRGAIFIIMGLLLIGGAALVGKCSKASAAPQSGDWMCLAVAERVVGSDLSCDATGVDKNKKRAEQKALKKCAKDCPSNCKMEICIKLK